MLASSTCPTGRDFLRLMLGQIPSAEAGGMEEHIRSCDLCQEIIREVWLEETFIAPGAEGTPQPQETGALAGATSTRLDTKPPPPILPTVLDAQRPPSKPEVAARPPSKPEVPARPASKDLLRMPARAEATVRPPSRPEATPRPPSRPEPTPRPPSRPEVASRPPSKIDPVVSAPEPVEELPATRLAPAPAVVRATPRSASVVPPSTARPPSKPKPAPREDPAVVAARLLRPPRREGEIGWIANYRVLSILGSGGTSLVVRAEEIQLGTTVALKILKPLPSDEDGLIRQRFVREGKVAAGLEHDHILTVYQVAEDRGIPFMVMRLLEGETLAQRLKARPMLPIVEVIRIGREIALGLQAAHEKGIVHRDVKPSNIWLESDEDRVKLLDFGLAKTASEVTQLHQEGVVGTPIYMAPEQAQGEEVDQRTDLYSLGCVLYRMTAGRPPLIAEDPASLMRALVAEEPIPVREFRPEAPLGLENLIARLLAKSPEDRPGTALEVVEELETIAAESLVPGADDFLPARSWGRGFWAKLGYQSLVAATVLFALYFLFGERLAALAWNLTAAHP